MASLLLLLLGAEEGTERLLVLTPDGSELAKLPPGPAAVAEHGAAMQGCSLSVLREHWVVLRRPDRGSSSPSGDEAAAARRRGLERQRQCDALDLPQLVERVQARPGLPRQLPRTALHRLVTALKALSLWTPGIPSTIFSGYDPGSTNT